MKPLLMTLLATCSMYAHTALLTCFDNSDNTITCEGGFSDGSSASGVKMEISANNTIIIQGSMDENSEFTFTKPTQSYQVTFNAGDGHILHIKGEDIFE